MEFKERLHNADYTVDQMVAMLDVLDVIGNIDDISKIGGMIHDQMGVQLIEMEAAHRSLLERVRDFPSCANCRHTLCSVSDYPCIECYCNSKWEEVTVNA